MLIDTHCHLNFKEFKDDWRDVIDRAFDNNIWMINIGVDHETSRRAVEIANEYKEGVYSAIGFHPIYVKNPDKKAEEIVNIDLYKNLIEDKKVIAVGEIGLDYYHARGGAPRLPLSISPGHRQEINDKKMIEKIRQRQKEVLYLQLRLAKDLEKPVIFHSRESTGDLMKIVQEFLPLKGVIHCFSESRKEAKKYLDMGFLISFTGIITFTDKYDETIKNIPLEKIMIETDSPYLTPESFRGKRNEPSYVRHIARKIAEIKNTPLEIISQKTTQNARKFFSI